jgi:hypothetical protein
VNFQKKLAGLCRRFHVPYEDAAHLAPLVRRALESRDPKIKRSLLKVVESSLERLSEELRNRRKLEAHLDRQYLIAVASVLHRWQPRDAPPEPGG